MKRYRGLMLVCLPASVPLFLIAAGSGQLLGGGRHFTGIFLCFPYGSLLAGLFPYGPRPIEALMWVLVFAQLPIYAAIIGRAWDSGRTWSRVIVLLLIHALAACACFLVEWRDENRWRKETSEVSSARARRRVGAPPNNGMHPTRDTPAVM